LVAHPSGHVNRAAVIGVKHPKYGEVVGAFLLPSKSPETSSVRPTDDELRDWVRGALGRHKAPSHVFWFGDEAVQMNEMPQTGSGKVKKHLLRDAAQRVVENGNIDGVTVGS
jgi:acyl-coenzyme A synthetase/AMP-(fatty) acid ligase